MTDSVPEKLGKYKIIEEVGRGGFAAVYKAVDTTLDRTVALKVLAPHLLWDPTFVQRFQREARVAANLDHRNIVTIYEVSQVEGVYFIAMRFLEGRTLSQILEAEGPLPVSRVQAIIEQLASALDYAHAHGFVHRDVKPSNVIVSDAGRATLTDFGLVKAGEGTKLSTTGVVFGTPEYMSPEQAEGKELDARSDIYSLGVVLFEMLAGRAPFVADTTPAVMYKHVHEPPPLDELPSDLPQGVVAVVEKALAKKREERYQSAGEMAVALQQAVSRAVMDEAKVPLPVVAPLPETPRPKAERVLAPARPGFPWKWVAVGGAVVVVVVGLIIALVSGGEPTTKPTSTPEAAALAPTATPVPPAEYPTYTPAPTNTPLPPTPTDIPTVPPTDTPTPKPVALVQAEALNVRGGPGTEYDVVGQVKQGDELEIVAQTEEGDWLQVRLTDGEESWVSAQLVEVGGGVTDLPVAAVIPPTPTPSAPPDMVHVPAGEFTMGSDEGDPDEQPVHTVYLDAFYIDKYEVTNARFATFVSATGYKTNAERKGCGLTYYSPIECVPGVDWQHPLGPDTDLSGKGEHPVVQVSWNDARAYCQWAGARLPTEAEWEKAARGTDRREYPWGNTVYGSKGNFCDRNCPYDWKDTLVDDGYADTAPVGSYPAGASPYGVLDMAGNVWEWVADWYDSGYYSQSPARNPSGPDSGESRVLRGGGSFNGTSRVRGAVRNGYHPYTWGDALGFRCARGSQ